MSLPGADLLFRPSSEPHEHDEQDQRARPNLQPVADQQAAAEADTESAAGSAEAAESAPDAVQPSGPAAGSAGEAGAARRPTGRRRHEEKITVYVSAAELLEMEKARLVLRGEHGLAVDRGRLVREAVSVLLEDLAERGESSILVQRLRRS